MTTMTIALPDTILDFLETQASKGGYASVSDYLRALLSEIERREAKKELEAKLVEGLTSGPAVDMTPQDWEDIRQELFRHGQRSAT